MPSFGPRCSWRRQNSRKYLFLKERRRRFMITNPEGATLLEHLINNIVLHEDQDLRMKNPNGLVLAGDENRRGNNINVAPLGNHPRPVGLPRGFIGSGRIRVRIPANNNNTNMCGNGLRRKPIQLINARHEAQNSVNVSQGFTRPFSFGCLLAREDTNIYDDIDDDDDGADDSENSTEEEEEEDEDEATDLEMEEEEEKDFTNTPSDLDEL